MGIGLNSLLYGVLYLGSHYNRPYIYFPHFGNSNLGKLPHVCFSELLRVSPCGLGLAV